VRGWDTPGIAHGAHRARDAHNLPHIHSQHSPSVSCRPRQRDSKAKVTCSFPSMSLLLLPHCIATLPAPSHRSLLVWWKALAHAGNTKPLSLPLSVSHHSTCLSRYASEGSASWLRVLRLPAIAEPEHGVKGGLRSIVTSPCTRARSSLQLSKRQRNNARPQLPASVPLSTGQTQPAQKRPTDARAGGAQGAPPPGKRDAYNDVPAVNPESYVDRSTVRLPCKQPPTPSGAMTVRRPQRSKRPQVRTFISWSPCNGSERRAVCAKGRDVVINARQMTRRVQGTRTGLALTLTRAEKPNSSHGARACLYCSICVRLTTLAPPSFPSALVSALVRCRSPGSAASTSRSTTSTRRRPPPPPARVDSGRCPCPRTPSPTRCTTTIRNPCTRLLRTCAAAAAAQMLTVRPPPSTPFVPGLRSRI